MLQPSPWSVIGLLTVILTATMLMPGTASAGAAADHAASKALVADEFVTIASVQSGKWKDPATWGGAVPQHGDRVLVSEGHNIKINHVISDRTFMTIRVDGMLWFGPGSNSELRVDTLVINTMGILKIGKSVNKPVKPYRTARIVITDFNEGFERDDLTSIDYDKGMIGQGVINMGQFKAYGAAKTPYLTLVGDAPAGTNILEFDQQPLGWRIGDKIVIAGTTTDARGDEVRNVTDVDLETMIVTLDSPLTLDHLRPAHTSTADLKIHIGNLTRNISIETAAGNEGDKTVTASLLQRGHFMTMNNKVDAHNIAMVNLGRTNKFRALFGDPDNIKARYPFHFHQAGYADNPALVEGVVVLNSPGWGYVNHSSNVDFVRNIAYDVAGASFVTENGDEDGSFIENLSIRNIGRPDISHQAKKFQFGHRGDGYWLQGLAVRLRGNIASGATGHAFGIWGATNNGAGGTAEGKHKFPAGVYDDPSIYGGPDTLVRLEDFYVEEFSNNTAYGNSDIALFIASHSPSDKGARTYMDNFVVWGTKNPGKQTYMAGVTFTNFIYIGVDGVGGNIGIAVNSSHKRPSKLHFENFFIEGFNRGIWINDKPSNVITDGYIDSTEAIRVADRSNGGVTIEIIPIFGPNVATEIVGPWQMP